MAAKKEKVIIYLGFNDPRLFKRGVENVINLQASCLSNKKCYYIFFGSKLSAFKFGNLIGVSIPITAYRFITLNVIILNLIKKNRKSAFIHSHNYLMSFFCLFKPDVFTVHDGLFYSKKQLKSKPLLFFALIERVVYWRSKKVHFISSFAKSKALYHSKKDVIIYNSTLLPPPPKSAVITTTASPKKILIVRSIEERVGFDLVIDFASYIQQKYQGKYAIEIAGKGPLLNYYRELVAQKNITTIIFLGYVPDTILVNKYADCFLVMVPAKYGEGFGLPIIEAYKFNKPVLASDVCAIPEIIINKSHLFKNTLQSIVDTFEMYINNYYYVTSNTTYSNYFNDKFSVLQIKKQYTQLLYPEIL